MDYQPLDIGGDELRLIYPTQNQENLTPSDVVDLYMKTVSLADYSSQSRDHMTSKGGTCYHPDDFLKSLASMPETVSSDAERAAALQIAGNALDVAMQAPSFGRWSWGDYMTLSYMWGDLNDLRRIRINGNAMEVTANLESFLRQYVTREIETLSSRIGLWIDALCINQNDIEERNRQVKRMRSIYEQAVGTVSWLGEAVDEMGEAIVMLQSLTVYQINTRDEAVARAAAIYGNPHTFDTGAWKALG